MTCASLVVPANGQISYATDMDPEFDGETVAMYSCIEGFGLKGGDVARTCEGSPIGTWSGNAPTCEGIVFSSCMLFFVYKQMNDAFPSITISRNIFAQYIHARMEKSILCKGND